MKPEYTFEKPTTKRSARKLINQMLIIIGFLVTVIFYVESHREYPEPKKIHHIWAGKGWTDSLNITTQDTHCRSTPNKD